MAAGPLVPVPEVGALRGRPDVLYAGAGGTVVLISDLTVEQPNQKDFHDLT